MNCRCYYVIKRHPDNRGNDKGSGTCYIFETEKEMLEAAEKLDLTGDDQRIIQFRRYVVNENGQVFIEDRKRKAYGCWKPI